jgi:hypothetical protein
VKRIILTILITAVVTGGGVWWYLHPGNTAAPSAEKAAAPDEGAGPSGVSHDEQGNTVVKMDDDSQGDAGIVVANPKPGQWSPEVKGYGRVLDPAPLVVLVNDLASARAAAAASSLELERQKILSAQSNTSVRTLEAAHAAVDHDQLAVQSAKSSLALAWGTALANREDLPAFIDSLVAFQVAIVRVDLPVGEALPAPPARARVVTLSGQTGEGKFLSPVAAVDPQMQGQGFIFAVETKALALTPGQAVTAFLQTPGDPLAGVVIPRNAVVRAEGAGWVYVLNKGGESFTRRKIPLDRPTGDGWFVAGDIKPEDFLVVTGAQTLRSEELKSALSSD